MRSVGEGKFKEDQNMNASNEVMFTEPKLSGVFIERKNILERIMTLTDDRVLQIAVRNI